MSTAVGPYLNTACAGSNFIGETPRKIHISSFFQMFAVGSSPLVTQGNASLPLKCTTAPMYLSSQSNCSAKPTLHSPIQADRKVLCKRECTLTACTPLLHSHTRLTCQKQAKILVEEPNKLEYKMPADQGVIMPHWYEAECFQQSTRLSGWLLGNRVPGFHWKSKGHNHWNVHFIF